MLISDTARDSARMYQQQAIEQRRKSENDFFNQQMSLKDFSFVPEGYESIVMAIYLAVIPYLMGLAFLLIFIARADFEHFLVFNMTSYLVIWAIGYEVCAVLILFAIFLMWLSHVNKRMKLENERKLNAKKRY